MSIFLGVTRLGGFQIDLSSRRALVGAVERQVPRPVIELPEVAAFPAFTLYPLADQVADKFCAMYETHGRGEAAHPSTRFRDLVDLVLIVTHFPLSAEAISRAITTDAARRQLDLPADVRTPGAPWIDGYPALAAQTSLDAEYRSLDSALALVGSCLNPILTGEVQVGTWSPDRRRWLRI